MFSVFKCLLLCMPREKYFGKNYSAFLNFTCNYEQMSGICAPCIMP